MTFSRVNPLGWALFEELTSAQMNQLDLNMVDAIDSNGGTYNLGGPLTLSGDEVTIDHLHSDDFKGTIIDGDWLGLDSRTIVKTVGFNRLYGFELFSASDWQPLNSLHMLQSTAGGSPPYFYIELTDCFPMGALLDHVYGYLSAAHTDGHASFSSITLPELKLWSRTVSTTGSCTLVNSQSDTSASQSAYEAYHGIDVDAGALDTSALRIVLEVRGEYGTDAEANELKFHGFSVSYTMDKMRY